MGVVRNGFSKHISIAALSACLAAPAMAQDNTAWGTRSVLPPNQVAAPAAVNAGTLNASLQYANASFGTGGVGLRNRGEGAIQISGVSGPIKQAIIYWAVITHGAPTTAVNRIEIKRGSTGSIFATLVGAPIGTGATPCWQGDRTTVYRSAIPLSIATGNGLYIVRLKPGANGSTAGGSPWAVPEPPLPLFEGASIVIVGTGTARVAIYDLGLAGKMFFDQLSYKLNLPVTVVGSSEVLLHTIGADGQIGSGVKATAAIAGEVTTLNGVKIAGPGSPAPGDWNGSIASPLPQLWDNVTHDVTTAAKANAATTQMTFGVKALNDCVVSVANVMSVR
jgi:hypothetical protein